MLRIVKTTIICLTLICFDRADLTASKTDDGVRNCESLGTRTETDPPCTTSDIFRRLEREMKPSNESSSELSGPPDSHEAMNNRQIYSKVREKRSYEFLMGLINNNSRYEVTRIDTEHTTQKPKIPEGVNASEILLELMVRIASHPDQWNKVHNLLQTIDQDLKTSKNVVTKIQSLSNGSDSNKTLNSNNQMNYLESTTEKINNHEELTIAEKKWPVFDLQEQNVQIVNSNYTTVVENRTQNSSEKSKSKSAYPKNFTYHRVTGKPDNTSKNPRAYIAVSVIAPRITHKETNDALENELHQLKPWSHMQNLKNMESIRSKWLIQNRHNKKDS